MAVLDLHEKQEALCLRYGVPFLLCRDDEKIGISSSAIGHVYPLNGLRLSPEDGTTGWFIWGGEGEPSTDESFFKSLHVAHLRELCPEILPYLGLSPGWRFLIAPGHEDVWFDQNLCLLEGS